MSVFDKIKHYKALKNGLKEGNNVTIMGGVNFGSEPYLIELADNVRLSFNVTFVTHDGGTWTFRDNKRYADVIRYGKIYVGEHTFIGTGVIIMPGVTIGKRCVIGAGAVITRDIPANSVAVGVPAKVISTTEQYAEKCLKEQRTYNKEEYLRDKRKYLLEWLK